MWVNSPKLCACTFILVLTVCVDLIYQVTYILGVLLIWNSYTFHSIDIHIGIRLIGIPLVHSLICIMFIVLSISRIIPSVEYVPIIGICISHILSIFILKSVVWYMISIVQCKVLTTGLAICSRCVMILSGSLIYEYTFMMSCNCYKSTYYRSSWMSTGISSLLCMLPKNYVIRYVLGRLSLIWISGIQVFLRMSFDILSAFLIAKLSLLLLRRSITILPRYLGQ